jgi:hypothetical protein
MDTDCQLVDGGACVCDDCYSDYCQCASCDEMFRHSALYDIGDCEVCEDCRENYSYCEECDEYYHNDDADEHVHGGCNCEAPAQRFSIRNDGCEPLASDTEVVVTMPGGIISGEGMTALARLLREEAMRLPLVSDDHVYGGETRSPDYWRYQDLVGAVTCDVLGREWQTREGNFPKRLSRYAYKHCGLRLSPDLMSEVGNIASAHSRAVDVRLAVTRNLNLPAEDFAHPASCWWGSYSESRCALKSNGGFGLRTFGEYGVSGRAWVMPVRITGRDVRPTFDAMTPDAFIVFNGYGDLSGYAPARIMAQMAGMTYRKISFLCSPMYVNGNSGYLVAPEEIAARYTDGSISLDLNEHSSLYSRESVAA